MSSLGQHLIPLLDVTANDKAFIILVQLIELIGNFLPIGLNGKIGLAERDNFLARVAVLHDQIAGIPG